MRDYETGAREAYRSVGQAFFAGLAKRPRDREALFTLAGVAAIARDTARALDAAQRLYAVDPLNRGSIRMLAQAWQLKGRSDSVLHYLQVAESLPLEVSVGSFTPDDKGATLSGLFTNLKSQPGQPTSLTFRFLDAGGSVVATHTENAPAMAALENRSFEIRVSGPGIVTWEYRR
jgi:hypothetical protein